MNSVTRQYTDFIQFMKYKKPIKQLLVESSHCTSSFQNSAGIESNLASTLAEEGKNGQEGKKYTSITKKLV